MKIKQVLMICSLGVAMAFCSCAKQVSEPVKFDENVKLHGDIIQDKAKYSVKLERKGNAGWQAVFESPETVKGLQVDMFNDSCTINFNGLTYTAQRSQMPEYGMMTLVTEALDDCINGKVKCEKSGDKVTERGSVREFEFTAELKDGEIRELTIPDMLTAKLK